MKNNEITLEIRGIDHFFKAGNYILGRQNSF
jgi:hypothetical protein